MISFAIVGCKKEQITSTPTLTTMSGSWYMTETHSPQPPTSRTIVLNNNGTITGGSWNVSGNTFTMTRYSTTYSGTISGDNITGTTATPLGTFSMNKQ